MASAIILIKMTFSYFMYFAVYIHQERSEVVVDGLRGEVL